MTLIELEEQRRAFWRDCAHRAGATAEGLRQFIAELGFVTFAPSSELKLPALASLAAGDENVLAELHASLDAELAAAHLIELRVWRPGFVYVPAELMPFIYTHLGGANPRRDYRREANRRTLSFLAAEVFEAMAQASGPSTVTQLRAQLGAQGTSALAVERALNELAPSLKVSRVGLVDGEAAWMPMGKLLPGIEGAAQAAGALRSAGVLLTQRLTAELLETEESMGEFFIPMFPRYRLHSALLGLEAARAVAIESLEGRSAYRLATPPRPLPGASTGEATPFAGSL